MQGFHGTDIVGCELHGRTDGCRYIEAMEMVYAAADIVVARAGAITCSELLVTAKPAILVCKCGLTQP